MALEWCCYFTSEELILHTPCVTSIHVSVQFSKFQGPWVPRHRGISGNEGANKLARQASATPLLGPEPALGIPKCSVREAIKNWTEVQHFRAWIDLLGLRYGKLFIGGTCEKRADNLLKLSRHQLKMVIATYTGHAPVRAPVYCGLLWWGSNLQILRDGDWKSAAHYLLLRGVG